MSLLLTLGVVWSVLNVVLVGGLVTMTGPRRRDRRVQDLAAAATLRSLPVRH